MTEVVIGPATAETISISSDASQVGLVRLLSYLGIFWLTLQFARHPARAKQLLRCVAWSSGAYAFYGLANYASGNELILWYRRWAYGSDVTATFVNRNSYATFAALGMVVCFALALQSYREKWRSSDRSLPLLNRRAESLLGRPLIYLLLSLVVATAWLQTHSRMGFASGVLGLLALVTLLRIAKVLIIGPLAASAGFISAGLLIAMSGADTLQRIDATREFDRLPLFKLTWEAISSAPWTGFGFNNFPAVLPMYRDLSLSYTRDYTQAHNTYLELAVELGLPATVALIAAVGLVSFSCLVGVFRRRSDRAAPAVAVSVVVVVGTHAITDFSIQIPAVAAWFSALLAAGFAQSWSTRGSSLQNSQARSAEVVQGGTASHRLLSTADVFKSWTSRLFTGYVFGGSVSAPMFENCHVRD